jgi:hypothetical protein
MSTNIQFEDIPKALPPLPEGSASLQKRYSADYTLKSSSLENQKVGLKPRNNSEMYIKPDPFGTSATPKRRPSSLDLLSGNGNMIGKMSFQFKNNHQHALRLAVDHKLRDVCTQDYLSSRALHMRDKDQIASYHSAADLTANIDLLKKKKSTSFIRSSASSFSLIPKRTSDSRQTKLSECDAQSIESSTSSVVEKQNGKIISSNSILRKLSLSTRNQSYSDIHTDETKHTHQVNRKPSQRKIVNKVLRRITSLRQRTSPCEDNSLPKVKTGLLFLDSFL